MVTAGLPYVREAWNEFACVLALVTETGMRTLPYPYSMLEHALGVQDHALYNAFRDRGCRF